MPSAPTNVLTEYVMQGQLLTNNGPNAYQLVFWSVYNTPDYTGAQSGYYGQLQNIVIASTTSLSSPTAGVVTPTSLAGGDLDGSYPNPEVSGIQGIPVSTVAPTSGQSLVYNGTEYAPGTPTGAASWVFLLSSFASHPTPARAPQLFFLCDSTGGSYTQFLPAAPNQFDIVALKDNGVSGAVPAQSGIFVNAIIIDGAPYTVQDKHTMAFVGTYPWGAARGDSGGGVIYLMFAGADWVVI